MKALSMIVMVIFVGAIGFSLYNFFHLKYENSLRQHKHDEEIQEEKEFYDLEKKYPPIQNYVPDIQLIEETSKDPNFSWRFEFHPNYNEYSLNYEEYIPYQTVYLDVNGKSYKAGPATGCRYGDGTRDIYGSVSPRSELAPNEITRILCWYAGSGDIYSVFVENFKYILRRQQVDEMTGYFPWETITTIDYNNN